MIDRNAAAQGLVHDGQPLVGRLLQAGLDLVVAEFLQGSETRRIHADLGAAQRFEQRFLEGRRHRHHLAGGFHLRSQRARGAAELVERPARHLHHHVVQRRLEESRRLAGDGVGNLVKAQPHGDLRRNLGDRVTGRLGGQSRRARHARVDFDHGIFEAVGIERELHVAATLHLELAHDAERRAAQQLVLFIGQRQRRRHDDGIAGVHAYGIEVLHGADGDTVVVAVAHHFELDLFPAGDAAFHEDLSHGRNFQAAARELRHLRGVVSDASAGAAQREGGADDDGVTDFGAEVHGFVHASRNRRGDHGFADFLQHVLEKLAVLGAFDRVQRRPQQSDALRFKPAVPGQLHGQGQPVLAADGGEQSVGAFLLDQTLQDLYRQRFDVDLVGDVAVGHDRGGVRIHENHLVALFLECEAGLRARIVELGGLSDHDRTGTDDHHPFQFFIERHGGRPPRNFSKNGRTGTPRPAARHRLRDGTARKMR